MPLFPVTDWDQRQKCVFATIGPVLEEWGPAIIAWINAYWHGKHPFSAPPRLKYEVSNDGYCHFHLGLPFADRGTTIGMFNKRLARYLNTTYTKPKWGDPTKGFSVRFFRVPHSEAGLHGVQIIDKYLDHPTKFKSTEGGNFVLELDGFNAHEFLSHHPEAIPYWRKYSNSKLDLPPPGPFMLSNSPSIPGVASRWKLLKHTKPELAQKIEKGELII